MKNEESGSYDIKTVIFSHDKKLFKANVINEIKCIEDGLIV